jgi:hypothetical protein
VPCLLLVLALAFPRITLVLIFLLSNYVQRAIPNLLFIVLGFLFLPLTTLVYAWAINSGGGMQGFYLVAVIVAVIIDLGLLGGSSRSRRSD